MPKQITLAEYSERILRPAVERLVRKTGKSEAQLIAEYERSLRAWRRFMREIGADQDHG